MLIKSFVLCFVFAMSGAFAQSGSQKELMGKMLDESTAVSPEVKAELRALHQKYKAEKNAYAEELQSIKMQLAEKLLDPEAKASDVRKLKKLFKKLEEKRINSSLKMLEQATKLLKPTKASTDADKVFNKHLYHLLHNDNL